VHYSSPTGDHTWRPDFEIALRHAEAWRLSKALTLFRSLKSVAATDPAVFTNIAVLCEMLEELHGAPGAAWNETLAAYSAEGAEKLAKETFDPDELAGRKLLYERIDQRLTEILLGLA